jgi:uncharacterized protein (DUF1499 family)
MKTIWLATGLVLAAALAIGYVLIEKRQALYERLANLGGARLDMGPVDFVTLHRRDSPNDALVCPPGHCRNAKPDWEAKTYDAPPAQLRARLTTIALAEPNTQTLPCLPACEGALRLVQYSRIMRFPDTIDVDVLPVGDDKSTLAIYSRSLLGYGDFGVNRARIARWLAALEKAS